VIGRQLADKPQDNNIIGPPGAVPGLATVGLWLEVTSQLHPHPGGPG
jgi:hypothetical protein